MSMVFSCRLYKVPGTILTDMAHQNRMNSRWHFARLVKDYTKHVVNDHAYARTMRVRLEPTTPSDEITGGYAFLKFKCVIIVFVNRRILQACSFIIHYYIV